MSCDKKNKLVGVFTDGNMKRLLIKNVNRNEKLKKYLKKNLSLLILILMKIN